MLKFVVFLEFNEKKGAEIINIYKEDPKNEITKSEKSIILGNSFPDNSSDKIKSDCFIFAINKNTFGYVFFSRTKDEDKNRKYKQTSLCVVTEGLYFDIIEIICQSTALKPNFNEIFDECKGHIIRRRKIYDEKLHLCKTLQCIFKEKKLQIESARGKDDFINFLKKVAAENSNNFISIENTFNLDIYNEDFDFLKEKTHYILEALIFGYKIRLLSKYPSSLMRTAMYFLQILYPLGYVYKVFPFFSLMNPKKESVYNSKSFILGVTNDILFREIDFDITVDFDQEEFFYKKKTFKYKDVIKSIIKNRRFYGHEIIRFCFNDKKYHSTSDSGVTEFIDAFRELVIDTEYSEQTIFFN